MSVAAILVKMKTSLTRSPFKQHVKVAKRFPLDSSHFSGYLKMWQLTSPHIDGYDVIVVDDAQECSECMLYILKHQRHHTAQVFMGDSQQRIYGFEKTRSARRNAEYTTHTYQLTQVTWYTFAAGVRIHRTWTSRTSHYPLRNSITRQSVVLESCSNHQKTRQIFESAIKKLLFFFVWKFWFNRMKESKNDSNTHWERVRNPRKSIRRVQWEELYRITPHKNSGTTSVKARNGFHLQWKMQLGMKQSLI